MTSEKNMSIERIKERNQRGCGSMQQKNDIAYLLELLDSRDRAHAELELKEVTKLRQEVKDLKLTIAAKERMIKAKQVVIDSGCDEYAKLEAELAAAREERDRLKNSVPGSVKSYIAQVESQQRQITALEAELAEAKGYIEKLSDPDFLENYKKMEGKIAEAKEDIAYWKDREEMHSELRQENRAKFLAEFKKQHEEIASLQALLVEKDKALKEISEDKEFSHFKGRTGIEHERKVWYKERAKKALLIPKCKHDNGTQWTVPTGYSDKSEYLNCPFCAPKAQADDEVIELLKDCRAILISYADKPVTVTRINKVLNSLEKSK